MYTEKNVFVGSGISYYEFASGGLQCRTCSFSSDPELKATAADDLLDAILHAVDIAHDDLDSDDYLDDEETETKPHMPIHIQLQKVNFTDLKIERQIGDGGFGDVYLATWNELPVAVKFSDPILDFLDDFESAYRDAVENPGNFFTDKLTGEIILTAPLRHPNIVEVLAISALPLGIVTQYYQRTSLARILYSTKNSSTEEQAQLYWGRRINMALDIAKGMLYLHSLQPPILHKDLKADNVLVDKDYRCAVADFHVSQQLKEVQYGEDSDDSAIEVNLNAGSVKWAAPELLGMKQKPTLAADVYSFAIVMWELLTWELPYGYYNSDVVDDQVRKLLRNNPEVSDFHLIFSPWALERSKPLVASLHQRQPFSFPIS